MFPSRPVILLSFGDASHPSRLLSFQELFSPMAFPFHSPQPPKGRASVRSRPVARQERKSKRSQSTTTCGYFRRICCEVRDLPCPPVATFSAIVLLPKRVKPWPSSRGAPHIDRGPPPSSSSAAAPSFPPSPLPSVPSTAVVPKEREAHQSCRDVSDLLPPPQPSSEREGGAPLSTLLVATAPH